MPTVFANGRSIVHKGDGQINTAALPDVCKTPSPGGPIPIPYVNVAKTSDLAKPASSIKIEGNPAGNAKSNLSTSTGDEPGTAGGGIISSRTKGKMTWGSSSPNVQLEGKGTVRFLDITQHNGNSYNTLFKEMGGTGLATGDDFQGPCPICRKGPSEHRILEKKRSRKICLEIVQALKNAYEAATSKTQKSKIGNSGRGFMVGVMLCKHDPSRVFAARSGTSTAQFERVATEFVDEVIAGGNVTLRDFVRANTSGSTRRRTLKAVARAWQTIDAARKRHAPANGGVNNYGGYNRFGACAASKLLARSGHAPIEMTEIFFHPDEEKGAKKYDVIYQKPTAVAPAWKDVVLNHDLVLRDKATGEPLKEPYPSRGLESVAPCHSCQRTLYLTLCPERVCRR